MFAAFNFTWPKVVVDIFAVASVATFSPELTAPGACVPACATKTPNYPLASADPSCRDDTLYARQLDV